MKNTSELKPGLSGILRIKNEEQFLAGCIESCVNSLDELIIVYNDCTDRSTSIIQQYASIYPDKIFVYEYPYNILGNNLNDEDYAYAKSLPNTDPRLLCSYYNFALSKVHYSYAIKIDADQFYFSDVLDYYRHFCKSHHTHWKPRYLRGWFLTVLISIYRRLSLLADKPLLHLLPRHIIRKFKDDYRSYAIWLLSKKKAAISFSGLNIYCNGKAYVCLGKATSRTTILPPFNGEGDHLLFPVSSKTHYEKFEMQYYNKIKGTKSIIEQFVHPYRVLYCDFLWIHLSPMRKSISEEMAIMFNMETNAFEPVHKFNKLNYDEILRKTDINTFSLFQRILFYIVHTIAIDTLISKENLIYEYKNRQ